VGSVIDVEQQMDDQISITDFDTIDLIEELEGRGYTVDDDLSNVETDLLIDELADRGIVTAAEHQLQTMYEKYVTGKCIDEDIRELFWKVLGRNV
jgi:hypothetical protein